MLATWQERADALDRAWTLAILARCRGLLQAARRSRARLRASSMRSNSTPADGSVSARTHLLALGRTERRAKRAAPPTLGESLAEFDRLDAPLWAEQTRAELRRIGGRAPSRGELSESELRVAALVAEGGTNKEVAAALFLAERTVASRGRVSTRSSASARARS